MRESSKTERMHLPRDTYEVWLKSQAARPSEARHRKRAAGGSHKARIKKRAARRRKRA